MDNIITLIIIKMKETEEGNIIKGFDENEKILEDAEGSKELVQKRRN